MDFNTKVRRVDGDVDFQQPWEEYVNGFGDVDGNFWLGLETIHKLTAAGFSRMKVYMESQTDGN